MEHDRRYGLTQQQIYRIIAMVGRIAAHRIPAEYRYDPTLKIAFVSELEEYKRGYWQAWNDMRDVLEGRIDKEELLKKAAYHLVQGGLHESPCFLVRSTR